MTLRYSARARSQLIAIHEHIEREGGIAAARRIGASLSEAATLLSHFPYAGRPGQVNGTREWVVRRFPYLIVYEVNQGDPVDVLVLGVFHCRQDRET